MIATRSGHSSASKRLTRIWPFDDIHLGQAGRIAGWKLSTPQQNPAHGEFHSFNVWLAIVRDHGVRPAPQGFYSRLPCPLGFPCPLNCDEHGSHMQLAAPSSLKTNQLL
jgi:hypothetical protein